MARRRSSGFRLSINLPVIIGLIMGFNWFFNDDDETATEIVDQDKPAIVQVQDTSPTKDISDLKRQAMDSFKTLKEQTMKEFQKLKSEAMREFQTGSTEDGVIDLTKEDEQKEDVEEAPVLQADVLKEDPPEQSKPSNSFKKL